MKSIAVSTPTAEMYSAAFEAERAVSYPIVDAFEARMGFAIDRAKLEAAARVLACPLKQHAPNWQHGRVLYSLLRQHFTGRNQGRAVVLDIGTAKGFSALCAQWALMDSAVQGQVVSVDVIDPSSRERRNTVIELEAPQTLFEMLRPWPDADSIRFVQSTGVEFLQKYRGRIDVAFVDGKHRGEVVFKEGALLADQQGCGDLVVFDDVHLLDVREAVLSLSTYAVEFLTVLPTRAYAIARRK